MRAYLDQQLLLGNDDTQECVSVYDLFKDYMDANLDTLGNGYQRTVQDHPLNSPQLTAHVNGLQENDVLFVKVPSIASYHYLTLICQGGYLMIFQKFGSYGRIYLTQTTAAIFSQIYNEYFALIAQYRASNTVLGKVENLTDGQVENMTHAFEHMYVLYGVNDLEYYVISRSRRIQRWLLKDRILPFSSYDSGKVI